MTLLDIVRNLFSKKKESEELKVEAVNNLKTEIKIMYSTLLNVRELSESAINKELALCDEILNVLSTKKSNRKAPKNGMELLSLRTQVYLENWEKGEKLKKPEDLYKTELQTSYLGSIEGEDFKALSKVDLKKVFNARRSAAVYAKEIKQALNKMFMQKYSS